MFAVLFIIAINSCTGVVCPLSTFQTTNFVEYSYNFFIKIEESFEKMDKKQLCRTSKYTKEKYTNYDCDNIINGYMEANN